MSRPHENGVPSDIHYSFLDVIPCCGNDSIVEESIIRFLYLETLLATKLTCLKQKNVVRINRGYTRTALQVI